MKTIRFLHDYRYSRKGEVMAEGDGVAEILIHRGIAEEVNTEEVNTEEDKSEPKEAKLPAVKTRRIPGPRE